MSDKFETQVKQISVKVEKSLKKYISQITNSPQILTAAMDYSLQAGGKRIRPYLLIKTANLFGLKDSDVMPAAAAMEMVHNYSLIHDDLPDLDNDSLRRSRPTNHIVFGVPCAILAGDAMLTYSFEVFAQNAKVKKVGALNTVKALELFARYAGASGMVGGQVTDIFAEGLILGKSKRGAGLKNKFLTDKPLKFFLLPKDAKAVNQKTILEYIHKNKTGALLTASTQIAATLAGTSAHNLKAVTQYANAIGLCFQITDDILDLTADKAKLGKKGSDKDNDKLTYVTLYGLNKAQKHAAEQHKLAINALSSLKIKNKQAVKPLAELADFILGRTY